MAAAFRRSIEVLGLERLLFGTDSSYWPRGWNSSILEQQAKVMYELGLDRDQASKILCSNLEQLHRARVVSLPNQGTRAIGIT